MKQEQNFESFWTLTLEKQISDLVQCKIDDDFKNLNANSKTRAKKVQKKGHVWPVNCARISIFSKFWIILELETKIFINFSTPKNSNITFLDRSRNTQKSRCSFSFKPPNVPVVRSFISAGEDEPKLTNITCDFSNIWIFW